MDKIPGGHRHEDQIHFLFFAVSAALVSASWAQTAPTSKEGAMIAGSYMGVMNLCRDQLDLKLTTEAKFFAEKAEQSDPEKFQASYNAEGHGMTFYDEEGMPFSVA